MCESVLHGIPHCFSEAYAPKTLHRMECRGHEADHWSGQAPLPFKNPECSAKFRTKHVALTDRGLIRGTRYYAHRCRTSHARTCLEGVCTESWRCLHTVGVKFWAAAGGQEGWAAWGSELGDTSSGSPLRAPPYPARIHPARTPTRKGAARSTNVRRGGSAR